MGQFGLNAMPFFCSNVLERSASIVVVANASSCVATHSETLRDAMSSMSMV